MKQTNEFIPYSVNIYSLCKEDNKLDFHTQIINRIIGELEKHENMGDHIRIVQDSKILDFSLDDDGLIRLSDILIGYFDERKIMDLWRYLRNLNEYRRNEYNYKQFLKRLTTKQIKAALQEVLTYDTTLEQLEGKYMVIDRLKNELKERKSLKNVLEF